MIATGNETPDISSHAAQVNRAYLWAISAIAALGGVLFGDDWVVMVEQNLSTSNSFSSPRLHNKAGR
jgi:hypothetical protein